MIVLDSSSKLLFISYLRWSLFAVFRVDLSDAVSFESGLIEQVRVKLSVMYVEYDWKMHWLLETHLWQTCAKSRSDLVQCQISRCGIKLKRVVRDLIWSTELKKCWWSWSNLRRILNKSLTTFFQTLRKSWIDLPHIQLKLLSISSLSVWFHCCLYQTSITKDISSFRSRSISRAP